MAKGLNPAEQLMFLHFLEILDSKGFYARGNTNENYVNIENYFLKMNAKFITLSENKAMTDSEKLACSYIEWKMRAQSPTNYNKIRCLYVHQLENDFDEITGPDGFLDIKRKAGEVFSRTDKLKLYELQEGMERDGSEIDIYKLYFGDDYHADHVKSVKDGGKTEISNGELMAAEKNLAKSSDSNEVAFDFQDVGSQMLPGLDI